MSSRSTVAPLPYRTRSPRMPGMSGPASPSESIFLPRRSRISIRARKRKPCDCCAGGDSPGREIGPRCSMASACLYGRRETRGAIDRPCSPASV